MRSATNDRPAPLFDSFFQTILAQSTSGVTSTGPDPLRHATETGPLRPAIEILRNAMARSYSCILLTQLTSSVDLLLEYSHIRWRPQILAWRHTEAS